MKSIITTALLAFSIGLSVFASTPDENLITACRQGDLAAAKTALSNGANPNATDQNGASALSQAFFYPELTKLLLDEKADPNGGNFPAIINAAGNYSVEVLDILIAAGADPNLPGVFKSPELERLYASIHQLEDLSANLKGKAKKDLEIKINEMKSSYGDGSGGMTVYALNQTVQQTNCVPCIEKLLAAGAKRDLVSGTDIMHLYASYGQTAAQRAEGYKTGAKRMEEFGFKLPSWYLALPNSVNKETEDVLMFLLKSGFDINVLSASGKTPFHNALAGGVGNKTEVMLALVQNGANITIEDPQFGKCFTLAARTGNIKLVEAMLAKGADIGETSKFFDPNQGQNLRGVTPLIAATIDNRLPMIKFLISKGASIKEDAEGFSYNMKTGCATAVRNKSALYFAIDNQNMEIIQYMVEVSGLKWYRPLMINELKKSSTSQFGSVQVTETSCYSNGKYIPSAYAKKTGLKDIAKYLKNHEL